MYGDEKFDVTSNVLWAPDCRHLVWSSWNSGSGPVFNDAKLKSIQNQGPYPTEGLFIFNDITKNIQKVGVMKKGDTISSPDWKDSQTVEFTKNNEKWSYNLSSQSLQKVK